MDNDLTIQGKLETLKHIHRVRALLYDMIVELDKRAREHDLSKLESPEAEVFGEHGARLGKVEYNSPEYHASLAAVKPAIEHHYANNRHHPEHWLNGVDDMTLVDLIEMLVDWKASTERVKNGNIQMSIDKNADRFKMAPQLVAIFRNTVREHLTQ